jgi:hypothetical protein
VDVDLSDQKVKTNGALCVLSHEGGNSPPLSVLR